MNSRLRAALSQLTQKWATRKERRQIVALAAAGAFLLFSFWNSFQNNRLKSDLEHARLEETIQSGRMYVPHAEADSAAVVLVEIDEQGHLKNLKGDACVEPGINGITDKLTFTPMKINNVARAAKVPVTIPLDSYPQEISQAPNNEEDSAVAGKVELE